MTPLVIFLQAGSSAVPQMLLLGGMILVFWLFMIRPQAKKAKMAKQFQEIYKKAIR